MRKVRIPKEFVPENVSKKDFYVNGQPFYVEVGVSVELPDDKADIVDEWIDGQQKIEDSRKKRAEELKNM